MGLAPGHKDDMYLDRAKALGLLAGITFLQYYMSCYGHAQFVELPLHCFCNNLSAITTIADMQNTSIIQPNDVTNDNCNVYLAICQMTTQCAPFQPSFLHVKMHQDKDLQHKLMPIKELNIECDQQVKQYTCKSTNQVPPLATQ